MILVLDLLFLHDLFVIVLALYLPFLEHILAPAPSVLILALYLLVQLDLP